MLARHATRQKVGNKVYVAPLDPGESKHGTYTFERPGDVARDIAHIELESIPHLLSSLLLGPPSQSSSLMSTNAIIAGMLASAIDNTVLSAAAEEDAIVKNETDNNEAGFNSAQSLSLSGPH